MHCNLLPQYIKFGRNPGELPFTRYFLFQWAENNPLETPPNFENTVKELFKKEVYGSEADTETQIIRPMFKLLGFEWLTEKQDIENIGQPDLLYYDCQENAKKRGLEGILVIVESKTWNESLKAAHEKQIRGYIDLANTRSHQKVKWGILTNGKQWRLYKAGRRGFVEFDLEQLAGSPVQLELARENNQSKSYHLKLFYTLFRKKAFENNGEFLNSIVEQSEQHQREIEIELHRQAYPALLAIFNGYWETIKDRVSEEEKEQKIQEVYEDSLYYLYRLLFVLFAEGRELQFCEKIPKTHRNLLNKLANDAPVEYDVETESIVFKEWNDPFAKDTATRISLPFLEIFDWLNRGNEYRDIPQFNGSLFLERPIDSVWIKDYYIGIALRLLKYSLGGLCLDYSSLDIRHLGNIYERLLLFEVPKSDKSYDFYYQGIVGKGRKVKLKFPEEWIYFDVDPSERKSTGTYYTPDYIVKFIVEETVGKKLEEIMEKPQRFRKPLRSVLSLKVLDPAMGSGHFLIRVIDEIASFIMGNIGEVKLEKPQMNILSTPMDAARGFGDITNLVRELIGEWEDFTEIKDKLTNEIFWKRIIAKRCIYGVDLKSFAVELAKLAIWLHTLSEDEPLQFLDHHLRCGNSLVGVWDIGDIVHPRAERFGEFEKAINDLKTVSELRDADIDQVKRSQKLYKDAHNRLEKFTKRLDVALAVRHFMEFENKETGEATIKQLEQAVQKGEEHKRLGEALAIAKEKRFFHWKIEFPEVWFGDSSKRQVQEDENSGFDVVVGNPPWGAELSKGEKKYIRKKFEGNTTDTSAYFVELGITLSKELHGMIVPKSLAFYASWSGIRDWVFKKVTVTNIVDVGLAFSDVIYESFIFTCKMPKTKGEAKLHYAEPLKKFMELKKIEFSGIVKDRFMWRTGTFILSSNGEIRPILEKIDNKSIFFEDIEEDIFGNVNLTKLKRESGKTEKELIGKPYFAKPFPLDKKHFVFIRRDPHLKRYYIKQYYLIEPPSHLIEWLKSKIRPRLLIKPLRGSRLVSFADVKGEFATHHHMISITFKEFGYSYKFAEAIINSPIPSFWLQKTIFGDSTETARELNKPYMRKIPIPAIYFATPEEELQSELKALKDLYQEGSGELTEKIESLLQKNWQPDLEKVAVHNSREIYEDFQIPKGEKWIRNDVVHEFLSYLAEQMSEFANNKHLLELYSSGKIEPKSLEEAEVYDIFDANSKEYNKKSARFLARIYEKKFDDTDQLINWIVYRLFDLTEKEIEILEDT